MVNRILKKLKNKKIAILGFGIEGKSSYNFIRKYFINTELTIICEHEDETEEQELLEHDKLLKFVTGKGYLENLEQYDVILKTPGISFQNIDISKFKEKITSQLELFLENKNCMTIGVTGTKGKSTTSTLIYKVLIEQGKDAYILGNIGLPIFDKIEKLNENSVVVLELSSHALQYIKASTDIAILLNIYEEHLDYYKSFNEYIDAKLNLFKNQVKQGIAIGNTDNENIKFKLKKSDYGITMNENYLTRNTIELKENNILYNKNKIVDINKINIKLKGMHNLNNIMFVIAVSQILKLDFQKTIKTIERFKGLEHRLEYVGTVNEVEYYNDSIATIPEATICSIQALDNVNTLIVGGKDRGINLEKLVNFLKTSKIKNIICMPKTGGDIANGLKNTDKNIIQVSSIEEAVNKAKEVTEKNKICLLSPAAASYGFFKNFIERGNRFKEQVLR